MISINHNVLDYWKRNGKPKIFCAVQDITDKKVVINGYVIKDGGMEALFRNGESESAGADGCRDVLRRQVTYDLDTELELL